MRFKDSIQIGGGIVSALYTAFGLANQASGWFDGLKVWSVFIAFVVFVGLVFWKMIDLQNQIKRLRNERPLIKVNPIIRRSRAMLDVINLGSSAEFTAKARIEEQPFYGLNWDDSSSSTKKIAHQEPCSLGVALVGRTSFESLETPRVDSFYINLDGDGAFPPEIKEVEIEISITSTPPLLEPFCQSYLIRIDNGQLLMESMR